MRDVKLGEVCHITDGAHSKVKRQESGLLYLTSKNIKVGELDLSTVDYISEEDFERLFPEKSKAGRRPEKGDILIGIIGTFGNAYVYKEDDTFGMSSSVGLIRPNKQEVDSLFLYYVITGKRFRALIESFKSGSVQGYTNIPTLKQIPFQLPELAEQKAIAHILGTLDDKIELNRQMNQSLEQMAQALFQSWFVDFDPVLDNAIAQGNAIPEALHTKAENRQAVPTEQKLAHTNPTLAAQFPSAFRYNETLGKWIPEGWEVKKIGDVATIVGGGTPSTKVEQYYCEEGIPWLSPKDLSGYEWKYISKGATDITELGLQKSSAKLMPAGTVVFSSRAPIGYVAIAENKVATNQGFKSLVPDKGVPTEYLFQFLKSNIDLIESVATGSTFKEVSGSALKGIEITVPTESLLKSFSIFLESSNSRSLLAQKQTTTLERLRDTLLPQLISGKLKVPPALLEAI